MPPCRPAGRVRNAGGRGWSLGTFGVAFTLMSAVTVVVGLLAGALIDRFSAVRLLPGSLLPLALSCFSAAWIEQEAGIFIFMAFTGVSYGFSSTISGAIWPELYGTRHLGAIRSIVIATMVLATAIGPGITGAHRRRAADARHRDPCACAPPRGRRLPDRGARSAALAAAELALLPLPAIMSAVIAVAAGTTVLADPFWRLVAG